MLMMEKKKPKRSVPRVPTAIPARWGVGRDCPRPGKILNLSRKGCLIQAQVEPLYGKTIFLRFGLPTGHFMELQGEVVHYQRNLGFALEFRELDDETDRMLDQLVEYYRQMGPDDPRHAFSVLTNYRDVLGAVTRADDEAGEKGPEEG